VAPATSPDDRLRKTCGSEETTERTKRSVGRRTPVLGGDVAVGQKVIKARFPPVPALSCGAALSATTALGTHAATAVATAKAATSLRHARSNGGGDSERIFLTPWDRAVSTPRALI